MDYKNQLYFDGRWNTAAVFEPVSETLDKIIAGENLRMMISFKD
jgi:hypothetical protein